MNDTIEKRCLPLNSNEVHRKLFISLKSKRFFSEGKGTSCMEGMTLGKKINNLNNELPVLRQKLQFLLNLNCIPGNFQFFTQVQSCCEFSIRQRGFKDQQKKIKIWFLCFAKFPPSFLQ